MTTNDDEQAESWHAKLNVGLLLSQSDYSIFSERGLGGLRPGLRAIFKALAQSIFVETIHLISIQKASSEASVPLKSSRRTDLLDHVVGRVCRQLESSMYGSRTRCDLSAGNEEQYREAFNSKYRGHCVLPQIRNRYWSDTSVTPTLSEWALDLLVRGSGLGIERGNILTEGARLGILSLHHGFNDHNRGGPVGFWEIYYDEVSGITAQILSRELDGGSIVSQNMLRSATTPELNRHHIYAHTGQVVQHAIARLAQGKERCETDLYFRPILKAPQARKRLEVSLKLLGRYARQMGQAAYRKVVRGTRYHSDIRWRIFVSPNPYARFQNWQEIHDGNVLPRGDWVADPFAISIDGRDYLLFEHWTSDRRRGHIGVCEMRSLVDVMTTAPARLIMNDSHLSYPYTFERGGRTYVMPENQDNGVKLYELVHDEDGRLKAIERRSILDGYWVDPSVIRINDYDYLFVSEGLQASVLRLFLSSDITQEPVVEHPMSPVVVDARTGRNSGRIVLESNGTILRPAQECSVSYGARIHFCRHRVTPHDFDDLGVHRTLNMSGHLKSFHHFETYRGLTFHDCVTE